MNKKPIVINLFAGPGAGKSVAAADLFSYLKKNKYVIEYVTEKAKDLTYSKNFIALSDQLYLLGSQHHRLWKLAKNNIDVIVTDSPIILGLMYLNESSKYNPNTFQAMVMDCWNQYTNICIFIERNDSMYQNFGRNQELEEAKEIDKNIKTMLDYLKIPYYSITQSEESLPELLNIIDKELHNKGL